jgi:hypothetical protein
MNNFSDSKRMLFISPKFFGYEHDIQVAFENLGLKVDFIDERPHNSAVARALVRVMPRLLAGTIKSHYAQQSKRIYNNRYDYVFLLKGEVVPESFLEEIWAANPDAQRVFYTYDSLNNTPASRRHLGRFDTCWTIDYEDAANEPDLHVLPLFYTRDFRPRDDARRAHEIAFVGTVHSGRYDAVKSLFSKFSKTFAFFYCAAPWYFFLSKYLVRGEFRTVRYNDVSFTKLSRGDVAQIFRDSIAVADIQRRGQSGLTMRTFEVLASGSSLITTNHFAARLGPEISKKVLVLDDFVSSDSQRRAEQFIEKVKADSSPPTDMIKYSIDQWAKTLLDIR